MAKQKTLSLGDICKRYIVEKRRFLPVTVTPSPSLPVISCTS